MSYYSEKKADDILKEIAAGELAEFSGGEVVSSPKMTRFVLLRFGKSLLTLAVAAYFGAVIKPLFVLFLLAAAIYELVSLVKFFRGDRMVELIAYEAKKAPDKRIPTIILEICVRQGAGTTFTLRETKPATKRSYKPLEITLCAVFAVLAAVAAVYFFVPFTLYAETEGGYAVSFCRMGLSDYASVTPFRKGKPVVGIKSGAYKNNYFLKGIALPDTLEFIEGEAFMNCVSLKSVEIPPKATEIRGDTFHNCKRLKTVLLHDNITALHAACFMGCESLMEITLPHGITEIRENTFNGCYSLMRIDIPEGVTRIAARAFFDCNSLYDVFIPQTMREIRSSAFRSCERLVRIVLPKGCSVDERAFKESPTEILYY